MKGICEYNCPYHFSSQMLTLQNNMKHMTSLLIWRLQSNAPPRHDVSGLSQRKKKAPPLGPPCHHTGLYLPYLLYSFAPPPLCSSSRWRWSHGGLTDSRYPVKVLLFTVCNEAEAGVTLMTRQCYCGCFGVGGAHCVHTIHCKQDDIIQKEEKRINYSLSSDKRSPEGEKK